MEIELVREHIKSLLDRSWNMAKASPVDAIAEAHQAENLALEIDDTFLVQQSRFNRSWCLLYTGKYHQALGLLLDLLPWYDDYGDSYWLSKMYNAIGYTQQRLSRFGEALESYWKAREHAINASNTAEIFTTTNNLASLEIEKGEYQIALQLIAEADKRMKQDVPDHLLADIRLNRCKAQIAVNDVSQGEINLRKVINFARDLDYKTLEFDGLITLAMIYSERGQEDEAMVSISEAMKLALSLANTDLVSIVYLRRAQVLNARNNVTEAIENLSKCLYFVDQRDNKVALDAHRLLSSLYKHMGNYRQALEHYHNGSQLEKNIFHTESKAQIEALQIQLQAEKRIRETQLARIRNKELNARNQQLEIINLIGREVASSLDIHRIIQTLHKHFAELMGVQILGVALINEQTQALDFKYFIEKDMMLESFSIPLDTHASYATYAVNTGELVFSNNAREDAYEYFGNVQDNIVQGSFIYVPLYKDDAVYALFTLQSNKIQAFKVAHIELVRSVSLFLSIAILNALTHQHIQTLTREIVKEKNEIAHLASHDRLTKLNNRIGLESHFDQLSSQEGIQFAVVYIDLDKFKPVNDQYGHEIGDEVLQILAERMRRATRRSDIAARIGGDEFVIILNGVSTEAEAQQIVMQLQEKLSSPISVRDLILKLEASFGIAFYPEHGHSLKAMLKASDEAMYRVKYRDDKEPPFAVAVDFDDKP
ncbi:sensor domain-containing diguanylate cyclase [Gynuella sunshinyii]|uniref:GGDEF domain n=1 Tax=Gynuella sunshinyii YC6258 TaxID=1445510 RepID=A0A0C5VDS4_9GAMM|nr:sensor domain-containing diguanylate cyclase [Gynuella sunshinyii]AJQ92672.1 GGDEF domain [Gynuella sunshinyii YC6258]